MSATLAPAVDLEHPVFVIGVGRSGTSLVQAMLDAHPALAFPPETHVFRRYVADEVARARREARGPAAFAAELERDEDFARAGVPAAELVDLDAPLDVLAVFRRLLARCAEAQGKPRVGDKDPRNIDYLPALHLAFPGAHVLHVVRDPRDVLLSRTKAAWSAARPWWSHALIYREQPRRGRRLGAALFGARYHELRYEALLAEPEARLREVCAALELDFSPAMLADFGASAARLVDQRELSWKRETLGPLLAANAGKWRAGLRPAQVRFTEAMCAEAFDELGYERSQADASAWTLAEPVLGLGARLAYDWKLRRSA